MNAVNSKHIMKTKIIILTLALGASTFLLTAQDANHRATGSVRLRARAASNATGKDKGKRSRSRTRRRRK